MQPVKGGKMTHSNITYFPSVRLAFDKVTRTLDNLITEAEKNNLPAVAEAYRQAFTLIRQGIEQIEHQGESTLHKHLENEMKEVLAIAHNNCTEIKTNIEDQFRESLEAVTTGIIRILQKKHLNDQYISNMKQEIETYALEEVTNIFSEEGIGFSGD